MTTDATATSLAHHFRLVVDNCEGDYRYLRALVTEEAANSETPRADLADSLRAWAGDMLFPWDDTGEPDPLNMLQREMLGVVLSSIDWWAMAADLLDEEE